MAGLHLIGDIHSWSNWLIVLIVIPNDHTYAKSYLCVFCIELWLVLPTRTLLSKLQAGHRWNGKGGFSFKEGCVMLMMRQSRIIMKTCDFLGLCRTVNQSAWKTLKKKDQKQSASSDRHPFCLGSEAAAACANCAKSPVWPPFLRAVEGQLEAPFLLRWGEDWETKAVWCSYFPTGTCQLDDTHVFCKKCI